MTILANPIKLLFTKASSKDSRLITLNLGQLKKLGLSFYFYKGCRLIVEVVDGRHVVPLVFTVNRCNSSSVTATTKAWPFRSCFSG